MTHSPHANFHTSFAKKALAYTLLFAGLIFGALNAVGAFATSNSPVYKEASAKTKIEINEKLVEIPQESKSDETTPENTVAVKGASVQKSTVAYSVLDYSKYADRFSTPNQNSYERNSPDHLEAIGATRTSVNGNPLTGQGVVIGIVDSGINTNLSAFQGANGQSRIVAQNCYGDVSEVAPCNGNSAHVECAQLDVGCFHGTAVADLAAGNRFTETLEGGSKISTGGVAPAAKLNFARVTLTKNGELNENLLAQALNTYVSQVNANSGVAPDVVNISIGFPRDGKYADCNTESEIKNAINNLVASGVVVVASSGNSGDKNKIMYPACLDNVISVGATQFQKSASKITGESVASFTQNSSELDLVAPGTDIMASRPLRAGFASVRGTSFATPIVTGSIALIKEANPSLNAMQIRDILISSGDRVSDPASSNAVARINVLNALRLIAPNASRLSDPQ